MSGPFYGSLAASASVFVAILTALLVNNYVQIKSDRRQVKNELSHAKEELQGLKDKKDIYSNTVEELEREREGRYRQKAEERVKEFIEEEIPGDIFEPIENLEISDLYQRLMQFHDCESAEELEESTENLHHREALEDRIDEIENKILYNVVHSFATRRRGEGWESDVDSDGDDLADIFEEAQEDEDGEDVVEEDTEEVYEIDVKAEDLRRVPLELEDFIEKYKQEYDLDNLNQKTKDLLETEYDEVVDQNPMESLDSTLESAMQSLGGAMAGLHQARGFDHAVPDIGSASSNIGLSPKEQRELDEAQKNLRDVENQIDTLERTKNRLEREEDGLNPEDLKPTLYVNAATIFLSVVVPVAAYLDALTDFTIKQLHFLNIWWITGSWLLGLLIVFIAIFIRITGRELRTLHPQRHP